MPRVDCFESGPLRQRSQKWLGKMIGNAILRTRRRARCGGLPAKVVKLSGGRSEGRRAQLKRPVPVPSAIGNPIFDESGLATGIRWLPRRCMMMAPSFTSNGAQPQGSPWHRSPLPFPEWHALPVEPPKIFSLALPLEQQERHGEQARQNCSRPAAVSPNGPIANRHCLWSACATFATRTAKRLLDIFLQQVSAGGGRVILHA